MTAPRIISRPASRALGAAIALAASGSGPVAAASPAALPAAIYQDPAHDAAHPPRMLVLHIPSHGAIMNGVLWAAAGPGPHPAAIICHGFPGTEQNLDLAQTLRRAGWSVLTFHYRGAWGSAGAFSFAHVLEDTQAALDVLRDNAARYEIDPHDIVLMGHSMGGMATGIVGARNPDLLGTVLISAANFGTFANRPGGRAALVRTMASNIDGLAGTSPGALADEVRDHAQALDLMAAAPGLARRPTLILTADDGLAPSDDALAQAVDKIVPGDATVVHIPTDHGYSDSRIALQAAILNWLATLGRR